MTTKPYTKESYYVEMYHSNRDLGVDTPVEEHEKKADEVYSNLRNILKEGRFRVHLFPHGSLGLEELTE